MLLLINNILDTQEWPSKEERQRKLDNIKDCYNIHLDKSRFIFGKTVYKHLNDIRDLIEKVANVQQIQLKVTVNGESDTYDPYNELKDLVSSGKFSKPFLKFLNFPGVKI